MFAFRIFSVLEIFIFWVGSMWENSDRGRRACTAPCLLPPWFYCRKIFIFFWFFSIDLWTTCFNASVSSMPLGVPFLRNSFQKERNFLHSFNAILAFDNICLPSILLFPGNVGQRITYSIFILLNPNMGPKPSTIRSLLSPLDVSHSTANRPCPFKKLPT